MTVRTWASLLALVLLSWPAAARAVPATIRAFEAPVHASPDRSSPVVHTFTENTPVSVSEDSVNGFRKVRLPDGKVGYIEENALALAGAQQPTPAPSPPPGFVPPPPPAFVAPPGPPPMPPYYPARLYYDPTAFRHVGFFLRFDLGFGYMGSSTSVSPIVTFDNAHGFAGELGLAVGGAVAPNVLLAAHFWGTGMAWPTLTSRGISVPSGGDFAVSLYGIGPSFDFYFMPKNIYLTVTPSVTWLRFSDAFNSFESSAGFGTRFALGKEWWVSPHTGIGLAGWFAFSFNKEGGGGSPTWNTFTGGITFSTTFN